MTKTRRLYPTLKKQGTATPQEWNRLLRKAIQMAEACGSIRRLRMLKTALGQDKAREYLKRLSIICEADLQREFGQKR